MKKYITTKPLLILFIFLVSNTINFFTNTNTITQRDKSYNAQEVKSILKLFHTCLSPTLSERKKSRYLPSDNFITNQEDNNIIECKNFLINFCSRVMKYGFLKVAARFDISKGTISPVNYVFFKFRPKNKSQVLLIKYFIDDNSDDESSKHLFITPINDDIVKISYKMNSFYAIASRTIVSKHFKTFSAATKLSLDVNGMGFIGRLLDLTKHNPQRVIEILQKHIAYLNISFKGTLKVGEKIFKIFEINNDNMFRVIVLQKLQENLEWSVVIFKKDDKEATSVMILNNLGEFSN